MDSPPWSNCIRPFQIDSLFLVNLESENLPGSQEKINEPWKKKAFQPVSLFFFLENCKKTYRPVYEKQQINLERPYPWWSLLKRAFDFMRLHLLIQIVFLVTTWVGAAPVQFALLTVTKRWHLQPHHVLLVLMDSQLMERQANHHVWVSYIKLKFAEQVHLHHPLTFLKLPHWVSEVYQFHPIQPSRRALTTQAPA